MSLYTALPFRPLHISSAISSDMSYGQQREDPIVKAAAAPTKDPAHGAAIIFLHGLDDDAHGWEGWSTPLCPIFK